MNNDKTLGRWARTVGQAFALTTALCIAAGSAGAASPQPAATPPKPPQTTNGEVLDSEGGIPTGRLQADPLATSYANDCKMAAFWKAEAERAASVTSEKGKGTVCYDQLAVKETRDPLIKAADRYIQAARAYFAHHPDAVPPKGCTGAELAPTDAEKTAQSEQEKAKGALADAEKKLADMESAASKAKLEDDHFSAKLALLGGKGTRQDVEDALRAREALSAAQAAVKSAEKNVDDKKKELDAAGKKVIKADADAEAAADAAIGSASASLTAALETVQGRERRSPDDFEKHVDDPAWIQACADLRRRAIAAGTIVSADEAAAEGEADDEAKKAHEKDILRKSPSIPSAMGSGAGFLETGGAPDHAVYTLFSSLGADQKTTGTQVLMTLNLGQLVPGGTPTDRPAWLRNLFLRAGLPLTATKSDPVAGASETSSSNNLSRMSFVLGTSLFDSTDPRVSENRPCYMSTLHYVPMDLTSSDDTSPSATQRERGLYYDVCNRRAANRQRLALRFGLGLVVEDDDASTTRPEYLSGAAVWAPSSWLYVDLLYQRLFLPFERHSFGGGVSTTFNTPSGLAGSGVDSWGRFGMDLLVLGTFDDATRSTDIEARLQLTARLKLPTSGIITLGLGPRLLGSAIADPGVLASVGLTYDADTLIEPLLSGPPASGSKSK